MSRYGRQRVVKSFKLEGDIADDTDVNAIVIPANREVEVYKLRAYSIADAAASANLELVDSSDAVLTSVDLDPGAGTLAENSDTSPVEMPTSTSDDVVKFKIDAAAGTGASTDIVIECHYSYPGAD